MKIRILCYKPAWDGHFLDDGISIWSRLWNLKAPKQLKCSHSEVWIPTKAGNFRIVTMEGIDAYGTCYTSTMRKPYNGVCSRPASSILHHPDRWNYFEVEILDKWYAKFVEEMETDVANNQGYDKWTIASFFWYKRLGRKDKFICSEICWLWILHWIQDKDKIFQNLYKLNCPSPIRLAHALHKSGLDLYSLETGKVILKGMI